MTTLFLLLSKTGAGFGPIEVVCASTENTDRLTGNRLTFTGQFSDLENALYAAGLSEFGFERAFSGIRESIPSFIPVTEAIAVKLGLLAKEAQ